MKKLILFSALALLFFATVGCEKNKEEKEQKEECACNSEKIREISDEGTIIFYKPDKDSQEFFHYYGNKFWITVKKEHSTTNYIICNQKFLKEKFDTLKQSKKNVKVKFSGIERKLCKNSPSIASPADATHMYGHAIIELTSIEEILPDTKIIKILPQQYLEKSYGKNGEIVIINSQEELNKIYKNSTIPKDLENIDFSKRTVILGSYGTTRGVSKIEHKFIKIKDKYEYTVTITLDDTLVAGGVNLGIVVEKIPSNSEVVLKVNLINS